MLIVHVDEYKVMFEFDRSFFLNSKTKTVNSNYYIRMKHCLKWQVGSWKVLEFLINLIEKCNEYHFACDKFYAMLVF